jgi:dipeptidyl aminopeptidase/acylaminoacyl peptidase
MPKFASITAGIAIAVAFSLATVIAVRNFRAARLDFEPWPEAPILSHPESTGLPGLEAVRFKNRDGAELAGWYLPSANRAAVVLTHGTNADRSQMLPELRILAAAGFGGLAFDWPGDGQSAGPIHWDHGERDALVAAIDWLAVRTDVDPQRIGGLGFSMGGYVMTQVASSDTRLRAVILESFPADFGAYTRYQHRRWGPLSRWPAEWAVRVSGLDPEDLPPRQVISRIAPRPLLIIGGTDDPVIPPDFLRENFDAAREPKSWWQVSGAHHGDIAGVAPAEYSRRVTGFFRDTLLDRQADDGVPARQ